MSEADIDDWFPLWTYNQDAELCDHLSRIVGRYYRVLHPSEVYNNHTVWKREVQPEDDDAQPPLRPWKYDMKAYRRFT